MSPLSRVGSGKGNEKAYCIYLYHGASKNKKEIKGRMRRYRKRPTILGLISGVFFFFFFGLFFTLTPFFFYQMGMFNSDEPFTSLLFFAFSIPFLMGGLYIQYKGLEMMTGKLQVYGSSSAPDPTYWDHDNYS